ncbi:gamma-glutamyltranspeptidase/glutathione hydrolase [Cytobacillus oceanisediminis]|uniref:Glutathione hydrolase proenzyme n=1 Tax=Cytobacillus oceanisediminis TaxID=665099 RepID=A0A2V2ZSQ9_9BACI|nr:gamma-glutamyltransferase [Cytobacillus oceanisediminis]PWW25512.1 gamma-glutamyltranspeptidase/glutathione hydrolase [Cytobacillus oceanisediminis]
MGYRRGKSLSKDMEKQSHERETAVGTAGMVVSPHSVATDIGEKILREGGNAVDAAVAIQFALNVVEPMMTGIGGSGFFMVYDNKKKDVKIYDGHTRAPKGVHPEMFLDDKGEVIDFRKRSTHGTAVGIPGILKALDAALEGHGSKPLADLIQPAIDAAESGVEVNWVLEEALQDFHYRLGKEARAFYFPNDEPLKEGDSLVKEHLAKTFRILQKEGIPAFYEGEIAEAIVANLKEEGGFMTLEDLKNYRLTVDEPIWGEYKGYKIASSAPPSAGGLTVIQILKILEKFDLSQYDVKSWEKYYLITEAMRLAFADKIAYSGDPEFSDLPIKGLLHNDYIAERVKAVNFNRRNDAIDFGNPWKFQDGEPNQVIRQPDDLEKSETTHFTVVDQWGNIAACTSTVEHPFGSGIMVKGYGFLLNNELTDFDANPGGINEAQPDKRPVSCKSPTILFKNDKPVLTLGSPGGPTIIGSVFQTIINVVDHKMNLKEAIEEPRIFASSGPLIEWEPGISMEAKGELESKGFEFGDEPSRIGNVQAIQIDRENGRLYGAADSSREGKAAGITEDQIKS